MCMFYNWKESNSPLQATIKSEWFPYCKWMPCWTFCGYTELFAFTMLHIGSFWTFWQYGWKETKIHMQKWMKATLGRRNLKQLNSWQFVSFYHLNTTILCLFMRFSQSSGHQHVFQFWLANDSSTRNPGATTAAPHVCWLRFGVQRGAVPSRSWSHETSEVPQ